MVPHFALKPQIQLWLSAGKHNGPKLLYASYTKSKVVGSINPSRRSSNKQPHDRLLANRLRRIAASRPSGCFARAQCFEGPKSCALLSKNRTPCHGPEPRPSDSRGGGGGGFEKGKAHEIGQKKRKARAKALTTFTHKYLRKGPRPEFITP